MKRLAGAAFLTLAGCGGLSDPCEDMIGTWQALPEATSGVFEIRRDGESYFLMDATTTQGVVCQNGALSIGGISYPITYMESEDVLIVGRRKYFRYEP